MKNIAFLILLSLAITSCQKESSKNSSNAIRVVGQYESTGLLKTTFTDGVVTWNAGDKIGLFSDLAQVSDGSKASNVEFTASSSGAVTTFTSPTQVFFDGTGAEHSFSAIYPYHAYTVPATDAWKTVPIQLPDVQTQVGTTTTHLATLDYMVAKNKITPVVGGTSPVLDLTFYHVFAALKFDVTYPSTGHNLRSVVLTTTSGRIISVDAGNTIDIGQEPLLGTDPYNLGNPAGGKYSITLNTDIPISSTAASAYMVIYPGNQNFANVFTISLTNEAGKVYTITKDGLYFNRGVVYTVTVNIPAGAWE